MKVGDLVRLRDMGMPGSHRGAGLVIEIREKEHAHWQGTAWDSVKVYWGAGHRMNDRWMVRGSLEIIYESR